VEKLGGFPQACWLFCSPQDDLGLDDLNGWEVGKRIKNYCLRKGLWKTPFLLYTGWDKKFEPEKLAESGVDRMVAKPVSCSGLLRLLYEVVAA